MRRILTLAAVAVLVLLAAFWAIGGFDQIALWAAGLQRSFQNTIAGALRAARAGDEGAVLTLLGACFAYGLAHAAGPGHGKVLIGGYGMGSNVPMLRLSVIAGLASLGQAVAAVVLVYTGVLALDLGREALVGVTEDIMAPASYAAITAIGLWLFLRGSRKAFARPSGTSHHHDHSAGHDHGVCHECGHAHGPTLEQVQQVHSLRAAIGLIAGIAIRPCTGALFVLVITWQMGIGGLGIGGAFAMALGTAVVTIAVGLTAGGLRGGLLAGISGSARLAKTAAALEVMAGLTVIVLAGGLLVRAL
ncbi:nickel/cobalt efflux system [Sulfitobacter porphyrae]|nr:nickel/cobalt efflux system [Sulfitobacter porphyrae]